MNKRQKKRVEENRCPTCGDGPFDGIQGVESHHGHAHGEQFGLRRVTLECETCGDEFSVKQKREDTARFCSYDCRDEWWSETHSGENHPFNQEGFEYPSGPNHPRYEKIEVGCTWCGGTMMRQPNEISDSGRVFCDKGCLGEWRSENIRGENHPNYTNHQPHDRSGFTFNLKEEVRERDGRECMDCGMDEETHLEKRGTRLQIHHIIPVAHFDDPQDAHYKSNLITLCWLCHAKWDDIPGLKPQPVASD